MGNSCGCSSDADKIKDKALDAYLKKHHRETNKMTKFDKKDYWLVQDFDVRTYKACRCNEITDEVARSQDMQVKESINIELLSDQVSLFNAVNGGNAETKTSGLNGEDEETTTGGSNLLRTKAIQEKSEMMLGGE